jgi:ribosomal protein L37AE/L43A
MTNVKMSVHEQNAAVTKGFDLVNFETLKDLVAKQVRQTIKRYHPNHFMPVEDVAWDCFTTLWMKKFFHKYDFEKSGKNTYLWNGVKNYLIDQERGASIRPKGYSLDVKIAGTDDLTYGEMLDERMSEVVISIEAYLEVLDVINPEAGGSRINTRIKRLTELDDGSEVELSGYSVLYLSLSGYRNKEIAERFNVTPYYISQLYNRGLNELKSAVDAEEFEAGDIRECISVLKGFINKEEDTYICPHCHSKNTRFWSADTTSALPAYICRDCERSFSEFTKTPLTRMNNVNRLKFIDLGRAILEGGNTGELSIKADLGVDKVRQWVPLFKDYFNEEPEVFIQRKLIRWERMINEAEAKKATWK